LSVTLPNGAVLAVLQDTSDGYPGLAITGNDALAAVVEWHPVEGSVVLRTYRDPAAHYSWDTGASLLDD
jgi:hypothetical protein